MTNSYLDEFVRLELDQMSATYTFSHRARLTKQYAWAVPTEAAVRTIAELGPIVEIGAGTGYWAAAVTAAGGDVVAYDPKPHRNYWCDGSYFDVREGGPEAIDAHPDRTLFLCWPPYAMPVTAECLNRYRGDRLVYVGESDGCTSWDERLDDDGRWAVERTVELPNYFGVHDRLFVFLRTGPDIRLSPDRTQTEPRKG